MTSMADTRRHGHDFEQIFLDAQQRWLRPAEICEILQNHKMFQISVEPPIMPPSGSLFLFNRKVLRYFRKDGHRWRKKKDGKTVKEAHERLKHGSVDVLHCYYAHGEENENFQRRSYWMLEEELSNIVLVHYREVKGGRACFNQAKETPLASGELLANEIDSSASSSNHTNDCHLHSQTADTSFYGGQASEYEDAESVYNNQVTSSFQSYCEPQQHLKHASDARLATDVLHSEASELYHPRQLTNLFQGKLPVTSMSDIPHNLQVKNIEDSSAGLVPEQRKFAANSLEDILESFGPCSGIVESKSSYALAESDVTSRQEQEVLQQLFGGNLWESCQLEPTVRLQDSISVLHSAEQPMSWKLESSSESEPAAKFDEQREEGITTTNNIIMNRNPVYASARKQHLLDDPEDGLKKMDSFNRWMSKELGDVNELADPRTYISSSSGPYWDTVQNETAANDTGTSSRENLETYVSPSLSQDQLFSITDFSPSWTYAGLAVKVSITGKFLKSQQVVESCKWSCMFGEVEVPAEIIANGVLRCLTPMHVVGRVPFYVTCSNRLACSEVREFEYKADPHEGSDKTVSYNNMTFEDFRLRFSNLLCSGLALPKPDSSTTDDVSQLRCKLSSLLQDNVNDVENMFRAALGDDFCSEETEDRLLEKFSKQKLYAWLLQKAAEGGKGPNILDEGGQGVIHIAAALGYDWALEPITLAGVSVNFRDVNGWTALHWAAFCGSEPTVASLIALGAAPGALTHPTPKFPSAHTPADLASASGHKGIAGYLAEAALSTQLLSIDLDKKGIDASETSGVDSNLSFGMGSMGHGDQPNSSPLKDPLAAVCKASQAAARIYQVFRVQSFQRKQMKEFSHDKFEMPDECALSLIAVKTNKRGHNNESVHAAATRIQNKFRSYKGRKEFLMIRQRVVKIQAHVRGYQVRKSYKKIVWCVGIVEKVILRWRRKGAGLRGFKSEAVTGAIDGTSSKDDEYDFFKEGRKQTENRLQKALARVKSMVQYPEARDQYQRLLEGVNEIQENKVAKALASSEDMADSDDELIDIDTLLDDDMMLTAS